MGRGAGLVAFGVKGRLAALGRSERDISPGIDKREIRRSEFFEPETGFVAGIAELVVRGQNHGDFHSIGVKKWMAMPAEKTRPRRRPRPCQN
jgi:hypothetical protein